MGQFEYFVVFAEMRTGSNFLETNLNTLRGVTCLGEAFNPHFIGYPNATSILGIDQAARDADPAYLLSEIKTHDGLAGFRYFHDHDPRILDAVLSDPTCAKVILTRNPVESYVSWKIARSTNQWKLTDVKRRKEARATFDAPEFAQFVADIQGFQTTVLHRLQTTGQVPFLIDYDDLQSVEVLNGLATFLGTTARLEAIDQSLKVQNPAPLCEKVVNFAEMEEALLGADPFSLNRLPDFEPGRTPAVPTYVTGVRASVLFLPIKGAPVEEVKTWMAALDGVDLDMLPTRMSQKDLRGWKKRTPGHRSFTVLRHPVARAHYAFCNFILGLGPQSYAAIRQTLVKRYDVPIPDGAPNAEYSRDAHRAAFAAFLRFLKPNLAGQTAIRIDAAWCSQSHALQGFGGICLPDRVIREKDMAHDLAQLARALGYPDPPNMTFGAENAPYRLDEIYDEDIERRTAAAYARDYLIFGFDRWG